MEAVDKRTAGNGFYCRHNIKTEHIEGSLKAFQIIILVMMKSETETDVDLPNNETAVEIKVGP